MAKSSKEDWKTFWQILFITVAIAIVLSSEIESLQKEVVKQGKNINFLIHRDRILQEKIAKLEAQVEALECKLEKK